MPIIQTVIKGSGGTPTIPNYIVPKNNVSGVYKPDNTATSFTVNGATDVDQYALYYAFKGCTNLTSIDLSSLTTLSGSNGLNACFYNCIGLTSVNLSSLTTISSSNAMSYCFYGCKGLTTVTIGGTTAINFGTSKNQFQNMFGSCDQVSGIDLYIATDQATLSQFTGYPSFGATCEVRIHYTAQ